MTRETQSKVQELQSRAAIYRQIAALTKKLGQYEIWRLALGGEHALKEAEFQVVRDRLCEIVRENGVPDLVSWFSMGLPVREGDLVPAFGVESKSAFRLWEEVRRNKPSCAAN
jgi:hypothetical protein